MRASLSAADRAGPAAFCAFARSWSPEHGPERTRWVHGAFASAEAFVERMLRAAPTRCFCEAVREGRPCRPYLVLGAAAGALTPEHA